MDFITNFVWNFFLFLFLFFLSMFVTLFAHSCTINNFSHLIWYFIVLCTATPHATHISQHSIIYANLFHMRPECFTNNSYLICFNPIFQFVFNLLHLIQKKRVQTIWKKWTGRYEWTTAKLILIIECNVEFLFVWKWNQNWTWTFLDKILYLQSKIAQTKFDWSWSMITFQRKQLQIGRFQVEVFM